MSAPVKPWETTQMQNNANIFRGNTPNPAIPQIGSMRVPPLPPRPQQNSYAMNTLSSYSPYSSYGGIGYGSYGNMPYRSSLYSPYNTYGSVGNYNTYGGYGMSNYGVRDNAEERFVQYAEERSRNTFANIENIVRAFSSISMMLDNTFFAMTSSFRAVLSVAENFGRLRSVFGQIWYSVNLFRLFSWLYRKLRIIMGYKVPQGTKALAWNEAVGGVATAASSGDGGSNWSTLAFLGVILSAPYLISKMLPKYEDKCDPQKWKSSGIRAKAAFDFVATTTNELSLNMNDEVILAPKHIQDEMKLTNTGWAFATCNERSGVVPLNYLVVIKKVNKPNLTTPIMPKQSTVKGNGKRVSFGETQFFEPEQMCQVPENKQTQSGTAEEPVEVTGVEKEPIEMTKSFNATEALTSHNSENIVHNNDTQIDKNEVIEDSTR